MHIDLTIMSVCTGLFFLVAGIMFALAMYLDKTEDE